MTVMNRSYFALVGSVAFATASVATNTNDPAIAGISPQTVKNPANVAVELDSSKLKQNNGVEALPLVINAVMKDAVQRTGMPNSQLSVVEVKQQTWSDGCLGLGGAGICTQAMVPGWSVTVTNGESRWLYRTNLSGTVVKWDAAASSIKTARVNPLVSTPPARNTQPAPLRPIQLPDQATRQTETPTPQVRPTPAPTPIVTRRFETPTPQVRPTLVPTPTVTRRFETPTPPATSRVNQPLVTQPSTQPQISSPTNFTLAIRQPLGRSPGVIARVSLKAKKGQSYAQEQFVGDFKYRINKRANFGGGVKAGDRIAVRLYNLQNKLIGYSEFEVLPERSAVNLVVSNFPEQFPIVRTVYGVDSNSDSSIDSGTNVNDYFSQIVDSTAGQESVIFLPSPSKINVNTFQIAGLPNATTNSVYTNSLRTGTNAIANRIVNVSRAGIARALKATPGQINPVINVNANNTSTYEVSQLIGNPLQPQVAQNQPEIPEVQTIVNVPQPEQVQQQPQNVPPQLEIEPNQPNNISFTDVPANYWAKDFITELAQKEIIKGYQGRFRPNDPVTRGELAAMLSLALPKANVRPAVDFKDVSPDQWVHSYILEVYQRGFFELEPGNVVNPNKNVTRLDVLVALARGLNYTPKGLAQNILQVFNDTSAIPTSLRNFVAAATQKGLVVNYPNIKLLKPNQVATRADVAALIYQGMVSTGKAVGISSPYIVGEANKVGQVK
ncbi:S-layer domain-containing protein [Crinalium epipsammum PCC 9333]|uniref:S-layer domain-containing protein n=1 Tax=Crinalium epipsammum PCC 9333 TaxID=1173022 RepID=K9VXG3_9CYAN|nr:S-layer homology domain-containing protein [Crinalium epipsammum]AFZ12192.1 S-layer domain-containing protein [Crinalium epipsammum PCC 9333]